MKCTKKKGSFHLLGRREVKDKRDMGKLNQTQSAHMFIIILRCFLFGILIFLFSDFTRRLTYPQTECKREYIFNVISTQLSSRNCVLFSFYKSINLAMLQTCVMSCASLLLYMTTSAGKQKIFPTINDFDL